MYWSKAWEIGAGSVALRGSIPHPQRAIVEHDAWTIRRPIEDVHDACCDASIWERIGTGLPALVPVLTNEAGGIVWRSPPHASPSIEVRLRLERGRDERETRLFASVIYEPADGLFHALASRASSPLVAQRIHEALRQLKQLIESGQIATGERVEK